MRLTAALVWLPLLARWLALTSSGWTIALAEETARSIPSSACAELRTSDLPRLGRIRGDWLGPRRFVLADPKRHRMLAYEVSDGGVESIRAPVWGSWLPAARAVQVEPTYATRFRDGLVVAAHSPPGPDSSGEAQLVLLNDEFTPVHAIRWPSAARPVGQPEREVYAGLVSQVLVSGERVALLARLRETKAIVELTLLRTDGVNSLREDALWQPLEGEYPIISHLPIRSLAATEGTNRAMYALRFAKAPFIQVLGHPSMQRLSAFPESGTPLPTFPEGFSPAFYAVAESAAFPVGLYGHGDRLYVLSREFVDGVTLWELHHLDPVKDRIVGRTRLPTNAAHVSLLPGEKYWVLEESSSFVDDGFRQPIRLLLLDSEAVEAGGELRCD